MIRGVDNAEYLTIMQRRVGQLRLQVMSSPSRLRSACTRTVRVYCIMGY